MNIPNPNNENINNSTSEVYLRMKTTGDRYFMFFNAFAIDVEKQEAEEELIAKIENPKKTILPKKSIEVISIVEETPEKAVAVNKNNSTINEENEIEIELPEIETTQVVVNIDVVPINKVEEKTQAAPKVESYQSQKTKIEYTYNNSNRVTPIESPMVEVNTFSQEGYFIIANVFAVHSNATRFVAKLKSMDIDADYFINPKK